MSGLERRNGDHVVLCSNPAAATSLRNFDNSVYPALPVSFGGDTKTVGPFYLVSIPGEVKYSTQGVNVQPVVDCTRVGVNSAPELDFLANSKSNSGIGIELELALPSPGGIGIELELPSFELELESELRSSELNSELPSWN